MANLDVSITSASGETDFVSVGNEGRAWVGLTGTLSAGKVLVVVKANGSSTEYVADAIDTTAFQTTANEAGTGYSFFEEIRVPGRASVALKADANFSGSVTASVIPEPF